VTVHQRRACLPTCQLVCLSHRLLVCLSARLLACLPALPALSVTVEGWASSVGDPSPLMILDNHGVAGNWTQDEKMRSCLFDSFGCTSAWCVYSRQLQHFLGEPRELLG